MNRQELCLYFITLLIFTLFWEYLKIKKFYIFLLIIPVQEMSKINVFFV